MTATIVNAPALRPADETSPASVEMPRRHRWTLESYDLAAATGLERTELIDGEIFDMAADGDPHRIGVSKCTRQAMACFDEKRFIVSSQSTARLSDVHAPVPDVMVEVIPTLTPGSNIIAKPLLIIEVADTTLLSDQVMKASLYASVGVEDYWILNVNDRQLEVYRWRVADPARRFGWRYADLMILRPPATVSPLAMPSAMIDVAKLLP